MTRVRAAALQIPFAYFGTPQEFTDRVRRPIEQAALAGAQLIVLPNLSGYALFGMFVPDLPAEASLREVARGALLDSVMTLILERAQFVYDLYVHIFESLAARTETWLAPGTAPEVSDRKWYNTCLLFSPDGRIFGRQRQTHRAVSERAWGLTAGAELPVFDTPVGRLGLVVGEDVRYPEVARILALQGANVLAHPASAFEEGPEQFLLDVWREAQSNQVFGVQANFSGRGRSAIYAPVQMTEGHDGFLARAAGDEEEELVSAELDFDALQEVMDDFPIFDLFNYSLYRKK